MSSRTRWTLTRSAFLEDRQGRTFVDVLSGRQQPFDEILEFFNDPDRQRRMEESELHHDRPPLAGVVRELESVPEIDRFLATQHPRRAKRLRQAVGVVVRIVMERRGWQTTGKKGSLGVRAVRAAHSTSPGSYHNTGGLAFWFLRAERYRRPEGMPFQSVRARNEQSAGATRSNKQGRSAAAKVAGVKISRAPRVSRFQKRKGTSSKKRMKVAFTR